MTKAKTAKRQFRNQIRILYSLDFYDLDGVGLEFWRAFRDNPAKTLLTCSDKNADIVWRAVEKRMNYVPKD